MTLNSFLSMTNFKNCDKWMQTWMQIGAQSFVQAWPITFSKNTFEK